MSGGAILSVVRRINKLARRASPLSIHLLAINEMGDRHGKKTPHRQQLEVLHSSPHRLLHEMEAKAFSKIQDTEVTKLI